MTAVPLGVLMPVALFSSACDATSPFSKSELRFGDASHRSVSQREASSFINSPAASLWSGPAARVSLRAAGRRRRRVPVAVAVVTRPFESAVVRWHVGNGEERVAAISRWPRH